MPNYPVQCAYDKMVGVRDLMPHPKNPNRHPKSQIELLAKVIKRHGWRAPITISKLSGFMVRGHARHLAAELLKCTKVPADFQEYASEEEELEDLMADNQVQELSFLDNEQTAENLRFLKGFEGFDPEFSGFSTDDFESFISPEPKQEQKIIYTNEEIAKQALRWFRKNGFPYKKVAIHVAMQKINRLANLPDSACLYSTLGYSEADTFHPHRFEATTEKHFSPLEAFNDDRKLKNAIAFMLKHNSLVPDAYFSMLGRSLNSAEAYNFRPAVAMMLYRKYASPGETVLDTSMGYGGRLIGYIASGLNGLYIGIDPCSKTYAGNMKLAKHLCFEKHIELYKQPAEDISTKSLKGRCNFAFTSPPYFAKEHYSDEKTQSDIRYKTAEEWREKFLAKMLALQYEALTPGCLSVVNIKDIKIGSKMFPLVQWTINGAKKIGFKLKKIEQLMLPTPNLTGLAKDQKKEGRTEPLLFFEK